MGATLLRCATAFKGRPPLATGLPEEAPGTTHCRRDKAGHLFSKTVILSLLLTLLLQFAVLLVFLTGLLSLRGSIILLMVLLGRILLWCLVIRILRTGTLSVWGCCLIIRDLGSVRRLLPLLRLLCTLLRWNLLCSWRSRVVDADTRILI
ncbi:Uncharacterised protein [Mycobacteroides abscessus]|uniref:Transmembrane protein n=1 Tax=Mycobacteroides abscessus subsp. massiliense TaxID=1962118 RepID=A0AB38DMM5_9MYCO|nr:hypothetical protein A3N96_02835 [Mycobacteroides abscessus]EHB96859.1 hypothetical protein MAB47J26_23811 [Mycobacteroides abscessus 47J26]SKD22190.1 Uncharacterised protein [Mycobacteroides abscessus subsp. massiliense]AMU34216.1 hypothetical protein A3N98_02300 [Mycobacteroides abscessus]AMU39159.1 hypothetical protein A3N99_02300 [Mycobacteroides abscessus]